MFFIPAANFRILFYLRKIYTLHEDHYEQYQKRSSVLSLALYSHGNRLHFKMLTVTCETSILLRANFQSKWPLFYDSVLQYAV